jgi:aldehyde dehydrogenase (NAD+)
MTTLTNARLFIGGQFRIAAQAAPVIEAATGELLGNGAAATESEIDDAVAAARGGLDGWRATPAAERAEVLTRFADALAARAAGTNELCTRENGMPIRLSRFANGAFPSALLRYYSDLVGGTEVEEIRPAMIGHTIVRREPVGVVGAITPWNYPQALAVMKIAPGLAAGCAMVLKAAPETALDAMIFGEAAQEAELPPGVLNIVAGGAGAGAHLVSHPGVDKVAFTGSTSAGRLIAEACGRLIRPVTLELGGKSAAIILDDADLDATIKGLRSASFVNNGQTCHLSSRILAPRSRYEEIVDAVVALADGLNVGDPLDKSTHIGPLVSARQRERVLNYVEIGKSEGAKLVAGGSVPADTAPRLVRITDGVRRRGQCGAHCAGGDLRPRADRHCLRLRRRGDRDRERLRVRSCGHGLVLGHHAGDRHRQEGAYRHHRNQRLSARHGGTVRRCQGKRIGP